MPGTAGPIRALRTLAFGTAIALVCAACQTPFTRPVLREAIEAVPAAPEAPELRVEAPPRLRRPVVRAPPALRRASAVEQPVRGPSPSAWRSCSSCTPRPAPGRPRPRRGGHRVRSGRPPARPALGPGDHRAGEPFRSACARLARLDRPDADPALRRTRRRPAPRDSLEGPAHAARPGGQRRDRRLLPGRDVRHVRRPRARDLGLQSGPVPCAAHGRPREDPAPEVPDLGARALPGLRERVRPVRGRADRRRDASRVAARSPSTP